MSANRAVLTKVRAIIRAQPERHYQAWWLTGAFDKAGNTHAFSDLFKEPREADGLSDWAWKEVPEVPGEDDPREAVCGTRGCVGGWICLMTAPVGSLVDTDLIYVPLEEARREGLDLAGMHEIRLRRGGQGERRWLPDRFSGKRYVYQSIESWARDRAGLTEGQTSYLFAASRTRDQVLDALDVLIEEDGDATGIDLMAHFLRAGRE